MLPLNQADHLQEVWGVHERDLREVGSTKGAMWMLKYSRRLKCSCRGDELR
ncbi:uncharacterized protein PGTG_22262 [Puccinia graminis f. sp. tritici CRL 75-36-700-3]|uniref:Uncharacterized protein n=1 Tax=Puccinia graminis f. sp. tritici (strain CRL 75-36-700-3 / race SCCL) TaxID=418459 RepID=H6QU36_PUCGT|nr:uncharacterized protein PGTG_22262 [Puccinia graminis f. sp. tritici CRL 75-36-700-3]EHS64448.1 hypothetical protein PGTG_22262 [Puccinia graminis f. sp. tritici CRL 75-36-700-3]